MRSLAFLAAVFAIVLGSLLPATVAASAETGSPVTLCSGDRIIAVYDHAGAPDPQKPTPLDSLKCAACVLVSLTAIPPAPEVNTPAPPRIVTFRPPMIAPVVPSHAFRTGLRPPPTAPPIA